MSTEIVKSSIDDLIRRDGFVTSGSLAEALDVSRQTAHKRLLEAVEAQALVARGEGRGRRYVRPELRFAIRGAAEDRILEAVEEDVPEIATLTRAERALFTYAFGEMVNNAIDHSKGGHVSVSVRISDDTVTLRVEDDGIGAFASVRAGRNLDSTIDAAAEVTKGKVTTMPSRHSGEGIFFTSRAADRFELSANAVKLLADNRIGDVAVLVTEPHAGTHVECIFSRPVTRTLKEIFDAHTVDFAFAKTRTVVKLFGLGRDFVSRSEARRMLHGLETFQEIEIDFASVPGIGQGFADEIFRVFQDAHPEIRLVPVNMNDAVAFFVSRAQSAQRG